LHYYVEGQAQGLANYLWQGAILSAFGWIPGVIGIGLRSLAYRMIMKTDGPVAIDSDVRLRRTRLIRLGRNVFLDRGVYLHA
jgi:hypothetical protein